MIIQPTTPVSKGLPIGNFNEIVAGEYLLCNREISSKNCSLIQKKKNYASM